MDSATTTSLQMSKNMNRILPPSSKQFSYITVASFLQKSVRTKDMPLFLEILVHIIRECKNIMQFCMSFMRNNASMLKENIFYI